MSSSSRTKFDIGDPVSASQRRGSRIKSGMTPGPVIELVGVLDNVRSRYNVGAIFRTADGLGAGKLYLGGITPRPDREDDRTGIAKTALGAETTVPWEGVGETVDCVNRLKHDGYHILALETDVHGIPLDDLTTDYPLLTTHQRVALMVGHELYGIHADVLALAEHVVEIPMQGTKRSLNVEVSFAIAAYTFLHPPGVTRRV